MKVNTWLLINAIASVMYTCMLLFMPDKFLEMRGASTDQYGLFMSRMMGSLSFGYAVLAFLAWRSSNDGVLKTSAITLCATWLMAAIVLLMAQSKLEFSNLIWVDIIICLVFAIGFMPYTFGRAKVGVAG